jgi:hypothetical protein
MTELWFWMALFGLGAFHGINPAMGWLFAVALGLQEKNWRGVLRAIPPIALGHAASIALVIAAFWLLQISLNPKFLRFVVAALLFSFGLYKLFRARHPSWVGMRVGFRDLCVWSFLMASAHGAGLMLAPLLLNWPAEGHQDHHTGHLVQTSPTTHGSAEVSPVFANLLRWLMAVSVHSAGHLLVMLLIALVVYEKLGLSLLRRAWFNLDLLWVFVLMVSGILILFV